MNAAGLSSVARSALDLVFPRVCASCGGAPGPDEGHLCGDCRSRIAPIQPPFCRRCGYPAGGRISGSYLCHHCLDRKVPFDRARSAAHFEGPLRDLVLRLKYHQALWVAPHLADWAEACIRGHFDGDGIQALVPVPLHPARRRARGFNQSEVLARLLGRRLGLPVVTGALVRVLDTRSQTSLTAAERVSNLRHAFALRRPTRIRDRRVLLIDDVMTTGSTLSACAERLREGPAAWVGAATVARG